MIIFSRRFTMDWVNDPIKWDLKGWWDYTQLVLWGIGLIASLTFIIYTCLN